MKRISIAAAALALLALLLPAGSADATVAVYKDLKTLSTESSAVVMGKVAQKESRWGKDGKHIFTFTTLQVERVVRGEVQTGEIVVRTLGGEVGDVGMTAQGVCAFTKGEEAVLFLKKMAGGYYMVIGLSQGKLPVGRDASGAAIVTTNPPTPGLAYAKSVGVEEDATPPRTMKLDNFEALVRSY